MTPSYKLSFHSCLDSNSESTAVKAVKIPQNEEVERIELRRNDDSARIALDRYKKRYKDKMEGVQTKMSQIRKEQNDMETNLIKFNAFVKEKQLKAERGIKTEKEERDLRNKMTADIKSKEKLLIELTKAKV